MACTTLFHLPWIESCINNSELISTKPLLRLKGKTVTQVDLVFTTYKESLSFEQIKLNKKRLLALEKAAPAILTNPLVRWRLIGQKGSENIEDAKNSFHGFVIHYSNTSAFSRESETSSTALKTDLRLGNSISRLFILRSVNSFTLVWG